MNLDLSKLKASAAAHTAETQRLLDANSAHAAAAKAASASIAAAQAEIDAYAGEIDSQTAALKAFNDSNEAPAS